MNNFSLSKGFEKAHELFKDIANFGLNILSNIFDLATGRFSQKMDIIDYHMRLNVAHEARNMNVSPYFRHSLDDEIKFHGVPSHEGFCENEIQELIEVAQDKACKYIDNNPNLFKPFPCVQYGGHTPKNS